MRPVALFAAFILSTTLAVSAFAQTQAGKNESLLSQALKSAQEGECPAAILSPVLRGSCLQQMPGFGAQLKARGAIKSLEFLGTQASPNGPVEVYLVTFGNSSMTWVINTAPDGKALVMWSGG